MRKLHIMCDVDNCLLDNKTGVVNKVILDSLKENKNKISRIAFITGRDFTHIDRLLYNDKNIETNIFKANGLRRVKEEVEKVYGNEIVVCTTNDLFKNKNPGDYFLSYGPTEAVILDQDNRNNILEKIKFFNSGDLSWIKDKELLKHAKKTLEWDRDFDKIKIKEDFNITSFEKGPLVKFYLKSLEASEADSVKIYIDDVPSNVKTVASQNPEVIAVLVNVEMGEGYNKQALNLALDGNEESKKKLKNGVEEYENLAKFFETLKDLNIIDKTETNPMLDLVEMAVKGEDWFEAVKKCSDSLFGMIEKYRTQKDDGISDEERKDFLKENYIQFKELLALERASYLSDEEQRRINREREEFNRVLALSKEEQERINREEQERMDREQKEFNRVLALSKEEQERINREEQERINREQKEFNRVLTLSLNLFKNLSPQAGPLESPEAGSREFDGPTPNQLAKAYLTDKEVDEVLNKVLNEVRRNNSLNQEEQNDSNRVSTSRVVKKLLPMEIENETASPFFSEQIQPSHPNPTPPPETEINVEMEDTSKTNPILRQRQPSPPNPTPPPETIIQEHPAKGSNYSFLLTGPDNDKIIFDSNKMESQEQPFYKPIEVVNSSCLSFESIRSCFFNKTIKATKEEKARSKALGSEYKILAFIYKLDHELQAETINGLKEFAGVIQANSESGHIQNSSIKPQDKLKQILNQNKELKQILNSSFKVNKKLLKNPDFIKDLSLVVREGLRLREDNSENQDFQKLMTAIYKASSPEKKDKTANIEIQELAKCAEIIKVMNEQNPNNSLLEHARKIANTYNSEGVKSVYGGVSSQLIMADVRGLPRGNEVRNTTRVIRLENLGANNPQGGRDTGKKNNRSN